MAALSRCVRKIRSDLTFQQAQPSCYQSEERRNAKGVSKEYLIELIGYVHELSFSIV